MKNSKEWWSVSELLEKKVETLPKTDKGISKKAVRENWGKRQRVGVKGKTFEYYIGDMPASVQKALGFSVELTAPQENNHSDFIVTTPSGSEFGFELKAKLHKGKAGTSELMQAVRLIEIALSQIGKETAPQRNDGIKLSYDEHLLIKRYRKSSEEGQEAIMNVAEAMAEMQERKKESDTEEEAYVLDVA